MIKRIGHLAFDVKDMEKSLRFYCDVLGFQKAFELNHPDDGKPWIVYLKLTDFQFIELFYGGENKPAATESPIGFSHLCLEVDSIEEIAEHMRKHGVKLDVEPLKGLDHNWQCWVKDPDGNRIEFMQLSPESPHMNC